MTINSAAQSFSLSLTYTFAHVSVMRARLAPPQEPAPAQGSPAADSVTLSPESTTEAAPVAGSSAPAVEGAHGPTAPTAAPEVPAAEGQPGAPSSRASRRADALLNALDADKDGSITEQEFTEGAMALLRRAAARHHHRRVHDDDHEGHGDHQARRVGRLERKLEKLFDRLDVDGNGGVAREELTAALSQVTRGRHHRGEPRTESPAPGPSSPAPVASVSVTSVTVVAVAVQQYTAIGQMA